MAIDRKAYKADKKKYKKEAKNAKKVFKETGFKSYGKLRPKKSDYKEAEIPVVNRSVSGGPEIMKPSITDKGFKSGGPKVMRKETHVSYKPNTDDNENIGRGGKGPKPMSRTRRAKASVMQLKDGLVSRFQSSTPKIGKNKLMEPVIEALKPTMVEMPSAPVKKKVETKLTKGQKRSYELRDAHS